MEDPIRMAKKPRINRISNTINFVGIAVEGFNWDRQLPRRIGDENVDSLKYLKL